MNDAEWLAKVLPTYDTPAKMLRLVLENANWLTDGYYKDLGAAMTKQAEKVLADSPESE